MIEAVKQVGLYEMMDYAIIDGDNKIIGLYKGNMAKKHAQMNMKGAERQVGIKKPLKIMPVSNKKKGDTVIGIGELTDKDREAIDEDVKNALAGFDNRVRDAASMDRKDLIKAKELYKRKDVKGLRKHIYSLDTSPLETVMNLISIQDRPFFDKMYPNTRGGEFLARIAYDHRKLDENLDENKDDEKKRMKGAKLRLKMGDALDEKFTKKDFDDNEDKNKHTENGVEVVNMFGTSAEKMKMAGIAARHNMKGSISSKDQKDRDAMVNKYYKRLKEETINELKEPFAVVDTADGNRVVGTASDEKGAKSIITTAELPPVRIKNKKTLKIVKTRKKQMIGQPLQEDGHTDVSSAVRQCKTIVEDATQMMGKLQSMNGEESLPTWWTNKLAVASNSMNKIRDYLLVPSMQNERMEKGIDKLPRQFLNPDKEVMVMKKNKVIVIDKKDQDRYTKQGWELAEVLDKEDEPKVKEIVKKLKGASKAHAGQAKDLEKAVSETTITGKDLLENKYKEEKNGAQHFSKIEEDNYVWNFVYDDFGRTKLTTEPDKATHLVYTMEGKDNPQLLKLSEKEILDYKKGENYELSKKK